MKISPDTTLAEIGESGAWRVVRPYVARSGAGAISTGFGDDAAVEDIERPGRLVSTCDLFIEGVHFLAEWGDWRAIGRKAMAVNISDLAAMAARPARALVSVGLPPDFRARDLRALYWGLSAEARRWGAAIVGGDTTRADRATIHVAAWGWAPPGRKMPLRSRARPGMGLFVTGSLGDSAAGLALLADPRYAGLKEKGYARRLIRRHRLPEPRVEEALALAESLGEWAAMDLSDDLGRSVSLLARASGVCVEAESSALPVSRELIAFERDAAGMGERASAEGPAAPRRWAIGGGGEDYELLFAAAAELEELRAAFRRRGLRRAISRIGAISACPKGGARLDRRPWPCQGFEHFR